MASTISISISIPVELSIKIEAYIESENLTRSEFVKEAVEYYLNKAEKEKATPEIIEKIYEEILLIKERLEDE